MELMSFLSTVSQFCFVVLSWNKIWQIFPQIPLSLHYYTMDANLLFFQINGMYGSGVCVMKIHF